MYRCTSRHQQNRGYGILLLCAQFNHGLVNSAMGQIPCSIERISCFCMYQKKHSFKSLSPNELHNCRGQELSVGVLRERKRLTLVAQLTITMLPCGADALKTAIPMGDLDPLLLGHGSQGPLESSFQTASQQVQPFLHSSSQSVPIFYNRPPLFPIKIAHSPQGSAPHLIHGSLGPPESAYETAFRTIGSAVFAGFTNVTNRQIDFRPYGRKITCTFLIGSSAGAHLRHLR